MGSDRTVIVGASLGGLRVAEGLRRAGYEGDIEILGDEPYLPYDRPPLSKDVLAGATEPAQTQFRSAEELAESNIVVHTGTAATGLSIDAKTVAHSSGEASYDHLVIATGARANQLPGTDGIGGVYAIRTRDDAAAISGALDTATNVVVVGAGFIGAEAASSARERGLDVTVVEALEHPLERAVGRQAGAACAALHDRHGATLLTGVGVQGIESDAGRVSAVNLADGQQLDCDVLIVGIGVRPNTDWLAGSGLDIDNGVLCDEYLQAAPDVYALGDVCRWANPRYSEPIRIEHWTTTVDQSSVVANNIARPDRRRQCDAIPYFWSDQYGSRIQFAGRTGDTVEVDTTPEAAAYMALYRQGDKFVGVMTIDSPKAIQVLNGRLLMNTDDWDETLAFVRENFGA